MVADIRFLPAALRVILTDCKLKSFEKENYENKKLFYYCRHDVCHAAVDLCPARQCRTGKRGLSGRKRGQF